MVVFLTHGIHGSEAAEEWIVLAGSVVVHVQAVHHVQFLAVVLEALGVGVDAFAEEQAEGIVMVHLLHRARLVDHHAVVALMVLQVVVVNGRRAAEGDVAAIYLYLLQCSSLVYHIAAIIYCQAGVRIDDLKLPARRIIGVGCGLVRRVCDTLRQI